MLKRILVAIDGSEPALHAARFAANLAQSLNAQLTLAHAIEPLPGYVYEGMPLVQNLDRDQDKWSTDLLRNTVAKLGLNEGAVTQRIIRGPAAPALAELAKVEGYDLVVVGSHGRGGLARLLVGSTADRLVHTCEKPVLVVR
jgi:nucleotide-binding universal stress UspA family protein